MVAPIAARLALPGAGGRATATVFIGNSLALVLGVPLGTLVGQAAGWRVAFAVTGVAAAATMLALRRVLPALDGTHEAGFSTALVRRLARPRLVALYAITVAMVIGYFAAYSYLAPLAHTHGGIAGSGYGLLLFGYGAAGLTATIVLGRVVDARPMLSFALPMATIAVAAFILGFDGDSAVVTVLAVLALGGAFVSIPAMLQAAVLRVADDPDVASSVYVVAFQIGIGGGAGVGALLVDSGGLDATTMIAAAGAGFALVVGLVCRGLFPARGALPAEGHSEVAERE